jgi:hypothetical protein
MTQCLNSRIIPPYRKFDAYMQISKTSGALKLIKDYDRLADNLNRIRDLDFGVKAAWTASDNMPSYKGCEPMRTGRHKVHCN